MNSFVSFPVHSLFLHQRVLITGSLLGLLVACGTPSRPAPPASETPAVVEAPVTQVPSQAALDDAERERRYVADILYDGMRALRADRLMTPAENSAYHYFNRALAFDPGNTVALDGLQEIAMRYVQLADTAARQGQFDNAESFLRRAAQVDGDLPAIATGRQNLEAARAQTHSVHTLNNRELAGRQETLSQRLREIAALVAENDTFVMITAPNDEQGRWIYAQLQESLPGSRLRADIEIGDQASIRLVLPRTS